MFSKEWKPPFKKDFSRFRFTALQLSLLLVLLLLLMHDQWQDFFHERTCVRRIVRVTAVQLILLRISSWTRNKYVRKDFITYIPPKSHANALNAAFCPPHASLVRSAFDFREASSSIKLRTRNRSNISPNLRNHFPMIRKLNLHQQAESQSICFQSSNRNFRTQSYNLLKS